MEDPAIRPGPPWTAPRIALLVGVLAVLPFLPALSGEFVYDDHSQLEENPHLTLAHVPGYWLETEAGFAGVGRASRYNPIGWSLFAVEGAVSGGARPPWLFRATSLTVHGLAAALVALLLFSCVRRTEETAADDAGAAAAGLVGGLWFAWAPIQAEVACWPSARFESLAVVLLVAGAVGLVRARRGPSRLAWGLVAATSLLAKETTLPLLALLPPGLAWLTATLRRRDWWWGAAGAWGGAVALMGLRSALGVTLPSGMSQVSAVRVLACEGELVWLALLSPTLSLMRPVPLSLTVTAVAGLAGLAAVGAIGLWGRRTLAGRAAVCGNAWLALGLLPGATAAARFDLLPDRYAYIGVPGLALALVGAVLVVRDRVPSRWRRGLALALALLGLLWVVRDVAQCRRWQDDLALFGAERALWPDVPQTPYHLGLMLREAGLFEQAEAELVRATELGPYLPHTWGELAQTRHMSGDLDGAIEAVLQGLTYLPDDPKLTPYLEGLLQERAERDGDQPGRAPQPAPGNTAGSRSSRIHRDPSTPSPLP